MKQVGIEVRPYFDRSLDTIYGGEQCQNSRELSGRVICLPMGSQFYRTRTIAPQDGLMNFLKMISINQPYFFPNIGFFSLIQQSSVHIWIV